MTRCGGRSGSRKTYLPPRLLLRLAFTPSGLLCCGSGISVGRNVLLKRGVLVCHHIFIIIRVRSGRVTATYRDPRGCQVPATICETSIFLVVSIELASEHNASF